MNTAEISSREYLLTRQIIGPYDLPSTEFGELDEWQLPYFDAARAGLLRACKSSVDPSEEILSELQAEFKTERKLHGMTRSLEWCLFDIKTGNLSSELRPDQIEVLRVFSEFLKDSSIFEKFGYFKIPTGVGKTAIAAAILAAMMYKNDYNESITFDVCTPRLDIMSQTLGSDGTRGLGRFASHLDVGVFYGGKKDRQTPGRVITNTSFSNLMNIENEDPRDILIVDEIHLANGRRTKRALKKAKAEGAIIGLGMSATPKGAEDIFPYRIVDMKLREVIRDGYLSSVIARTLETDFEVSDDPRYYRRGDFAESEISPLILKKSRNELIAKKAIELVQEGLPTIVKCIPGGGLKHAYDIRDVINDSREIVKTKIDGKAVEKIIRAEVIDGKMSLSKRQEIYDQFEAGEVHILTFVKALEVGWDSMVAKGLVDACPSLSIDLKEQILGRILRVDNNIKDPPVAKAIDILDRSRRTIITFADVLRRDNVPYIEGMVAGRQEEEMNRIIEKLKKIHPQEADRMSYESTLDPKRTVVSAKLLEEEGLFREGDLISVNKELANGLGITMQQLYDKLRPYKLNAIQRKNIPQVIIDEVAQNLLKNNTPIK